MPAEAQLLRSGTGCSSCAYTSGELCPTALLGRQCSKLLTERTTLQTPSSESTRQLRRRDLYNGNGLPPGPPDLERRALAALHRLLDLLRTGSTRLVDVDIGDVGHGRADLEVLLPISQLGPVVSQSRTVRQAWSGPLQRPPARSRQSSCTPSLGARV